MAEMINLEIAIRDLVVSHEGFWSAKMAPVERRVESDWEAIKAWGDALKRAQEYLGVVIVPYDTIEANNLQADGGLMELKAAAKSSHVDLSKIRLA